MLLTDRLAVTCAHVVEAALRCRRLDEAPKGAFPVDLPAFPRSRLTARVAPGGWFRDPPVGDLAVLTLDGTLPAGAAPAPVGGGPVGDGASVLVYGHPATVLDGVWARARTVAAGGHTRAGCSSTATTAEGRASNGGSAVRECGTRTSGR
ncbi:hypothetical protein ACR6C2_13930 [Streptomyces sp. INA 01156]